MSTRCTLTIRDADNAFSIYRHSDGYPDTEHGVLEGLRAAFPLAWPLPRFEADEFAAAIVAAWKTGPGNIRFCEGRDAIEDTAFHYDVSMVKAGHALYVKVWERNHNDEWIPSAAYLVLPEKVKKVALSKADRAARDASMAPHRALAEIAGELASLAESSRGSPAYCAAVAKARAVLDRME